MRAVGSGRGKRKGLLKRGLISENTGFESVWNKGKKEKARILVLMFGPVITGIMQRVGSDMLREGFLTRG